MEAIDTEKYRAAVIRARAERLWFDGTPNKRAIEDEKRYARINEIRQINYRDDVTSDMNMIPQAFTEHYRKLFESFSKFMPRVDEVKATLEEPISAREIERAIEHHPAGNSPGPEA